MKKKLAFLAALAVAIGALVGCTKATVEPQPTLPHQGETASAEDGSVYAVGETVTAQNGDTQVAQPVTDQAGELVGVTLMTPEDAASREAETEAETATETKPETETTTAYPGHTNREHITTVVIRSTSPNRLTTRPTMPETEPKTVKLPESLSTNRPVGTTVAPKKVKVSYPGVLSFTANGETVKYQIDKYEASFVNDNAALTLTVRPLTALRAPVIVQLGYDCYDADGVKLNKETMRAPAALNPDGSATTALAPLATGTVRVAFLDDQA